MEKTKFPLLTYRRITIQELSKSRTWQLTSRCINLYDFRDIFIYLSIGYSFVLSIHPSFYPFIHPSIYLIKSSRCPGLKLQISDCKIGVSDEVATFPHGSGSVAKRLDDECDVKCCGRGAERCVWEDAGFSCRLSQNTVSGCWFMWSQFVRNTHADLLNTDRNQNTPSSLKARWWWHDLTVPEKIQIYFMSKWLAFLLRIKEWSSQYI